MGRSSFELARQVPEVFGIDFSKGFIRAARELRSRGSVRFSLKQEGFLTQTAIAKAPPKKIRHRVTFQTGNALRLPPLGKFDLVLAANLLDRVQNPKRLLQKVLPSLIRHGGLLLLTSPYTWSKEFTPPSHWLRDSFPTIQKLLCSHFRLAIVTGKQIGRAHV